jgi:hypothetical protein
VQQEKIIGEYRSLSRHICEVVIELREDVGLRLAVKSTQLNAAAREWLASLCITASAQRPASR